jgi:hypothetical protein
MISTNQKPKEGARLNPFRRQDGKRMLGYALPMNDADLTGNVGIHPAHLASNLLEG